MSGQRRYTINICRIYMLNWNTCPNERALDKIFLHVDTKLIEKSNIVFKQCVQSFHSGTNFIWIMQLIILIQIDEDYVSKEKNFYINEYSPTYFLQCDWKMQTFCTHVTFRQQTLDLHFPCRIPRGVLALTTSTLHCSLTSSLITQMLFIVAGLVHFSSTQVSRSSTSYLSLKRVLFSLSKTPSRLFWQGLELTCSLLLCSWPPYSINVTLYYYLRESI